MLADLLAEFDEAGQETFQRLELTVDNDLNAGAEPSLGGDYKDGLPERPEAGPKSHTETSAVVAPRSALSDTVERSP